MRPGDPSLKVPVIGVAFRPGAEAINTFRVAHHLDSTARFWAIVSCGDAPAIRDAWEDELDGPLLIVRTDREPPLSIACELLESLEPGPAALLLANLPTKRSLVSSKKFLGDVVRQLEESHFDLQVHLYHPEWLTRLPRIR
ncbi:MAG TPA: hypothetical protein PKA27_17090 [Fimbriimonadaceae bacterium]|nr:hypothetical protein [Fimbriimonadaceae bacterium]